MRNRTPASPCASDETAWAASADREAEEAYWRERYLYHLGLAADRLDYEAAVRSQPRTVANVRAASVAARWVALVVGIVVTLLAVVGLAYVWTDPVPHPAPLESERGF